MLIGFSDAFFANTLYYTFHVFKLFYETLFCDFYYNKKMFLSNFCVHMVMMEIVATNELFVFAQWKIESETFPTHTHMFI